VDTLTERFPDASATFLWMDVLCVSQAPTLSGNNPDWFKDGLVDLIASKRGAFAVFNSWKRTKLFDCSWCVWGMLAAPVNKKLLTMLLRSAEGRCCSRRFGQIHGLLFEYRSHPNGHSIDFFTHYNYNNHSEGIFYC